MKGIILMFLLSTFSAFAGNVESHLVSITRKDNGDVTKMFITQNEEGAIVKLRVTSPKRTQYVYPKNLEGKGKTLMSKIGIKILVLKSLSLNTLTGGNILIDYLTKWRLFGRNYRGKLVLKVEKTSNGTFALFHNGRQVKSLTADSYSKGIKKFIFEYL